MNLNESTLLLSAKPFSWTIISTIKSEWISSPIILTSDQSLQWLMIEVWMFLPIAVMMMLDVLSSSLPRAGSKTLSPSISHFQIVQLLDRRKTSWTTNVRRAVNTLRLSIEDQEQRRKACWIHVVHIYDGSLYSSCAFYPLVNGSIFFVETTYRSV